MDLQGLFAYCHKFILELLQMCCIFRHSMRETAIDRNQVKRVVRVNSHLKLLIFGVGLVLSVKYN